MFFVVKYLKFLPGYIENHLPDTEYFKQALHILENIKVGHKGSRINYLIEARGPKQGAYINLITRYIYEA